MPDEAEQLAIVKAKRMRGRWKSLRYIASELALDGYGLKPRKRCCFMAAENWLEVGTVWRIVG